MVRPNQTRPRPLSLLNLQASCPATCRASNASLGAPVPRARGAGGAAAVVAGGGRRLRHGASSYWFGWWSAPAAPAKPAAAGAASTAGVASASVETNLVADLMAEAHGEVASIEIEAKADSTEIESDVAATETESEADSTEMEAEVSSIEIDAEIQMQLEAEVVAAATTKALTKAPSSTEHQLMVWRQTPEAAAEVQAAAARCEVRGQGLAAAASRALALVAPSTLNLNP